VLDIDDDGENRELLIVGKRLLVRVHGRWSGLYHGSVTLQSAIRNSQLSNLSIFRMDIAMGQSRKPYHASASFEAGGAMTTGT
jgi:hypothetical protein